MRTTISIDDALLDEVKRRAVELRQTVSQVIEDSVREALLRGRADEPQPYRVRAFRGGAVQPGVDLGDNAALLDLMDSSR